MAEAAGQDIVMDSEIPETEQSNQLQIVQEGPATESLAIDIADHVQEEGPAVEPVVKKKAREKKDYGVARDKGRTIFPIARVQKIVKADKELPMIAKEAIFAISIAAEEFIKRLSQAAQKQAERERRATVQRRDLATVVRRADEFLFLDELITYEEEIATLKPRKKATDKDSEDKNKTRGAMDAFMTVQNLGPSGS